MSTVSHAISQPSEEDLYPSSDGQPMAETGLHGDEMTDLKQMLRRRFRSHAERVYVGCNLFVYYERGNPSAVFSPDVFVVHGAPQRQYDTYKLWQDGPAPSWVIEVTSKKTRAEDRGKKKALCETLGVREYFLYDPRAEYLKPPLQAFRLRGSSYETVLPDASGRLPAETLGLAFALDEAGLIVVTDLTTGERLMRVHEDLDRAELDRQRAEAERQRAEAERAAKERALARVAELEAELQKRRD